ncbi:MAG: hypothetical protein ACK56I_31275, partial [bacterium]
MSTAASISSGSIQRASARRAASSTGAASSRFSVRSGNAAGGVAEFTTVPSGCTGGHRGHARAHAPGVYMSRQLAGRLLEQRPGISHLLLPLAVEAGCAQPLAEGGRADFNELHRLFEACAKLVVELFHVRPLALRRVVDHTPD